MPDNSISDYTEPTPRGKKLAGGRDFGMLRQTDGHLTPDPDDTPDTDRTNVHEGW